MRKLTALSLSLFLCFGAFAQTEMAQKVSKANHESAQAPGYQKAIPVNVKGIQTAGIQSAEETGVLTSVKAKNRAKSPARASLTSDNVYASFIYPSSMLGISKMNTDNTFTSLLSYATTGYKVQTFGMTEEKAYVLSWSQTTAGVSGAWLRVYDLPGWTLSKETDIIGQFSDMPQGGAFNAEEMVIVGYASDKLVKLDVNTLEVTKLADCSTSAGGVFCKMMTYDITRRKYVGIEAATGTIFSLDLSSGDHNIIGATNLPSSYLGGFGYDITSDSYLWNPNDDSDSEIYSISASSLVATKICDVPGAAETGAFYVNETVAPDPEAPMAPEFISSTFLNGALFGQVSFKLPTYLNDGNNTPISGNVDYTVTANGVVVASGKGVAGSTVTANVIVTESGDIPFVFTATLNGHTSKPCKENIFIGNDTPLAPANVKLTVQNVTWNPVTKGVHNGYLDLTKMTYTVKINGELVADGITGTSCATNLPLTAELANYTAEVYAVCNGMTSVAGNSNNLLFGQAYSCPVNLLPTAEQADLFEVIDANADKKTWTYYATYNAFRYAYNFKSEADDWLILPPVRVSNHNNLYTFSLDTWSSSSYEEKFEVYVGPSTDISTMTKIMDEVSVKWPQTSTKSFSTTFEAPAGGKMHIAIHCTSGKDKFYLYVNNFNIEMSNVSVKGPAAVTDVKGTPGANGALNATVSFKMPTTTYAGAPLNGNVTCEVETLVDYKTVTGAPGSTQSVTLNCIQSTDEEIDPIVITPSQGNNVGMPTELPLWVGVDLPASPKNVQILPNETNLGGTLVWDKVTTGENGGFIRPAEVSYYLCQRVQSLLGYSWQIQGLIGTDVDHFDFTLDGALQTLGLSVVSENEAGMNTSLYGALCAIGTPFSIPAIETYPGGKATYGFIIYGSGQTTPSMSLAFKATAAIGSDYASTEHPYAMVATCAGTGTGYIDLAPFSTKGATKVAFIPNVYVGSCENIRVAATAYGVEETEIFDLSTLVNVPMSGYQDLVLELPQEFQNKDWVKFRIYGEFSTQKPSMIISGYSIRNLVPYEVAAEGIKAPAKVTTGQNYEVTVTAVNFGLQNLNEYTVELYEDDVLVDTKTGDALASDAKGTVSFTRTMSPIATEAVEYYAKVSCANDASDVNNTTETIEVTPKASNLPAATELQANNNSEGNAVTLTWLEPNLDNIVPEPITDDFEDGDAFAAEYGDWVFVDVDDAVVGGLNGTDIPGITAGTTKGSFWIWDHSQLGNQTFEAHSGTKYLFNMFNYNTANDGPNDDWAISPELAGCAQTITFWAKSYSSDYPEDMKLWYSTGSVDPEDFIEVTMETNLSSEWTEYSFDVPEGARRFAINCVSNDKFMLFVDDVTYIPAGAAGDAELKGYDIYRDGVKINNTLVEENDFVDTNVEKGKTYNYVVVAVFDLGTAKPSNTATITVKEDSGVLDVTAVKAISAGKGFIRINGFAGEEVVITTVDGKVVAKGNAAELNTVNVPAGVYVVKAGKNIAKVVVK